MNRSLVVICVSSLLVAWGIGVFSLHEGAAPASTLRSSEPPLRVTASALPPLTAPPPSPEQMRLEERRRHYEMVDSLLLSNQIERARQHLDEGLERHNEDAAEEWRDLDSGYRLIADCLEQPQSSKHRVRARAFIGVTEAPGLVPKIRAACGD